MDRPIRVLMADDEAQFRKTTQKILERHGFETILAASGSEALEKLRLNPDVVVLDIKMPGMDGHETLARIKEMNPELPVIMLTGHGALPSAESAMNQGAFDYISKPCEVAILSMKMRQAYRMGTKAGVLQEREIMHVMVPVEAYTVLNAAAPVREAILSLKVNFASKLATSKLMETGHRSILVMDDEKHLVGLLSIKDLIRAVMPPYLAAPKPSTADSMQYSPMFWRGLFTDQVVQLSNRKIETVMSPAPIIIDARANLMEAAYVMIENGARRLAVFSEGTLAGVIREQDLFFEMYRILEEPQAL